MGDVNRDWRKPEGSETKIMRQGRITLLILHSLPKDKIPLRLEK